MSDKFLKARIPNDLYISLLTRANAEGKRLSTHVRELLEASEQGISTQVALARIESALQQVSRAEKIAPEIYVDSDTRKTINEIRLIVAELAMHSNAQILSRVSMKLSSTQTK